MKAVMGPVNIAGQPVALARGLRALGVDVRVVQFGEHQFGYSVDESVEYDERGRQVVQLQTVSRLLEEGVDIFHFWLRSMFFGRRYEGFPGFDLPLIKLRGRKIIYRFTGFDVRTASRERKLNPFNAYRYGFAPLFDEPMQERYIAMLHEYVDQFLVQDIELQSYFPEAKIVPRVLDLQEWQFVGVRPADRPLVVHAPSISEIKGTRFILGAVKALRDEGLEFDFKLIQGMPNTEARAWYEKADIAIDQLHVGWYGVFALECMALGKPVIVYIRPDLVDREPRIPIHCANPENIRDRLRTLIRDYDLRSQLSGESRRYVEQVHDVRRVAERVRDLYAEVHGAPFRFAAGSADIDYFAAQFVLAAQLRVADLSVTGVLRQLLLLPALRLARRVRSILRRLLNLVRSILRRLGINPSLRLARRRAGRIFHKLAVDIPRRLFRLPGRRGG